MENLANSASLLLLGALFGGVGKMAFERYKFLQQRLVTANAICVEIEAKARRLIENDLANQLRQHATLNHVLITIGEGETEIYDLTKKDIGHLPNELAGKVVYFKALETAYSIDSKMVCTEKTTEFMSSRPWLRLPERYRIMAKIIDDSIQLSEEIKKSVEKLNKVKFLFCIPLN